MPNYYRIQPLISVFSPDLTYFAGVQFVVLVIGPPDWEIPTGAEKNLFFSVRPFATFKNSQLK